VSFRTGKVVSLKQARAERDGVPFSFSVPAMISMCLARPELLTQWERRHLIVMQNGRELSRPDREALFEIARALGVIVSTP